MFDLNENPIVWAYLQVALAEIEQNKNKRASK